METGATSKIHLMLGHRALFCIRDTDWTLSLHISAFLSALTKQEHTLSDEKICFLLWRFRVHGNIAAIIFLIIIIAYEAAL